MRCEKDKLDAWNPFGVGLVVGLGAWSLLLQRSQVRFPLVTISVGLVPSD